MSSAMDKISYADLYARWERGNWQATALDFSADREQWHEGFSELERRAALWNYSMFFHGEDAVADDLAPFIDAAPREEQKYFLATQQVDEARHSVFFHRFMEEVVERGDGTHRRRARRDRARADLGLPQDLREARRGHRTSCASDRSRTALARAVTMYHFIVEATLAQPGQHFIGDYLARRTCCPASARAWTTSPPTSSATSASASSCCTTSPRRTRSRSPPRSPTCCARSSRPPSPCSCRRASTAPTRSASASRSRRSTPRARARWSPSCGWRACRSSRCPGPQVYPYDLPVEERATRALAMLRAGYLGEKNGGAARDPESMALLFDSVRRAVDPRTAPDVPMTLQWEFPDAEPWHLRLDNGSTAAAPGRAPAPDVELRVAFDDWVDVIAGRLDPKKAVATRRLKLKGSPRALWRARGVFG